MDARLGRIESSLYTTVIELEERSRAAASAKELASIIVDGTRQLLPYQSAALWLKDGEVRTLSFSGLDPQLPAASWLDDALRRIKRRSETTVIAGADMLSSADAELWRLHLPRYAIWATLSGPDGSRQGTLMLARDEPWSFGDIILLNHAAANYGAAWFWLNKRRFILWRRLRNLLHRRW